MTCWKMNSILIFFYMSLKIKFSCDSDSEKMGENPEISGENYKISSYFGKFAALLPWRSGWLSVFFLSKVMDVGWWGWYLSRRVPIIFWHGFHSNRKGGRGHVLAWASDRSLETAMLAINIFESVSGVRKMNQKCRKMLPLRWAIFSKCSHDQRTFPLPSALKGCSNRNFLSYLFCPLKTARLKFLITTSTTISSVWNMLK